MSRRDRPIYHELKDGLPAPARRVIEELVEVGRSPEEVLGRLVDEEGRDIYEAFGYVREVLSWALMEMTGSDFLSPLAYAEPSATPPVSPLAAG